MKNFLRLVKQAGFELDDLPNILGGTQVNIDIREPIVA
jgi:hypothetical protein